jgi:hypothetical protein
MKKLALITALLLATSPVAAQVVTGTTPGTSTGTTTGVICIEMMLATFCNVPTAPNTSGYGSSSATGSSAASGSSGGAGSNTSSIPTCPEFPPARTVQLNQRARRAEMHGSPL